MTKPCLIDLDGKFIEIEAGNPETRIPISARSLPLIIQLIQVITREDFERYLKVSSEEIKS